MLNRIFGTDDVYTFSEVKMLSAFSLGRSVPTLEKEIVVRCISRLILTSIIYNYILTNYSLHIHYRIVLNIKYHHKFEQRMECTQYECIY